MCILTTWKTHEKLSQGETQPDQSHARTFAWVNECLLELKRNSQLTFYHEIFRNTKSISCESHTFLCTFSSLFLLLFIVKVKTQGGYFIEKIVITICNRLNIHYNRLFIRSNRLYYHFNWLKCSSQYLKKFQEQCNRLDSWSLMGTLLRVK